MLHLVNPDECGLVPLWFITAVPRYSLREVHTKANCAVTTRFVNAPLEQDYVSVVLPNKNPELKV